MRGNNFQFSYSREASVKRSWDLNIKAYYYECNMNCLALGLPPIKALKANEVGKISLTTEACFWHFHEQSVNMSVVFKDCLL